MDFNDLDSRIKRLNHSLGKEYELDIKSQVKVSRKVNNDVHEIGFSFGAMDETEIIDRIFNVVNNIASLKDHLKNKLMANSKDPNLVEDMINNSMALKLILDLWNQDKHGYPLTKTNRSKLNPKIVNVGQGLIISNGDKASVSFTITENDASYTSSQNAAVVISGDVIDEYEKFIVSVEDMFRQGVLDLENFLKSQGLI